MSNEHGRPAWFKAKNGTWQPCQVVTWSIAWSTKNNETNGGPCAVIETRDGLVGSVPTDRLRFKQPTRKK